MSRPDPGAIGGFALIEIMVGITLGLMVALASVAAIAFTLAASSAGRDSADLQQRADSALRQIGEEIRHAGAIRLDPFGNAVLFSDSYKGWGKAGGPSVSGTEGGPGRPDTLRLSYQQGPQDYDCIGNQPKPKDGDAVNHMDSEFLIAADRADARRSALYCNGAVPGSGQQSIVSGVDDLQVLFGVQDAVGNFRFVTAAGLSPTSAVRAVDVCLQVSSQSRQGVLTAVDCNGARIAPGKLSGRMVRLARGVFMVRNAGG